MVRPSKHGLVNDVDRQALLTTLTTEHFTLAGARGATISESSSRAALYMLSLVLHHRWERRIREASGGFHEVLFPTP